MELLLLCWEFLKIGLFAVGGGMATIPFLTKMSEHHPEWFSLSMLADMIAVSESTPGPIGINMATYVGYTVSGVYGAVLATVSLALPAFIILLMVSRALQKYRDNRLVDASFRGLRPAVTGIIAAAGFVVLKMVLLTDTGIDFLSLALFAIVLLCTQIPMLKKLHPVVYIGAAAVIGIGIGL